MWDRVGSAFLIAAVAVTPLDALVPQRQTPPTGATIVGIVYDSVSHGPLAGAYVQLVPADGMAGMSWRRTVTSDSIGQFEIDSVPQGRFVAGFFHPKLDSLGIEAPLVRVEVQSASRLIVDLAVPSVATVVGATCGGRAAHDSTGLLTGFVRDAKTARPIERATIDARWSEILIGSSGTQARVRESRTSTSESGWFGLCGVPPGGLLLFRASTPEDSGRVLEIEVPDDGLLLRDFFFEPSAAAREESPDAFSTLRGVVRDGYGAPLRGATVRLWGTEHLAVSNDSGLFSIGDLPPGTHMVEARAIGFVPHRLVIDLFPGQSAEIGLDMSQFALDIDTVRVFTTKPRRVDDLAGFAKRRRLGHGVFLDPDEIELRHPNNFSDLLRGLNGVDVISRDMMSHTVAMRGLSSDARCEPVLVIDGMRVPIAEMNIDDLIPATVVRAVEVYPRRIQAPPEYQSLECGSIVVWTGARGWLAKRMKKGDTKK